MDRNEAHAALDAMAQTRSRMAETTQWPLWRHALFGVAETFFVIGISLPALYSGISVLLAFALIIWLFTDDKKRYGMFVSGWHGQKPRLITLGMTVVVVALAVLSWTTRGEPAPAPLALLAGLATLFVCTLGSIWWQSAYKRELREAAAQ